MGESERKFNLGRNYTVYDFAKIILYLIQDNRNDTPLVKDLEKTLKWALQHDQNEYLIGWEQREDRIVPVATTYPFGSTIVEE